MSFGEIIELIFICLQAVYICAKSSAQKNRTNLRVEPKKMDTEAATSRKRKDSKDFPDDKEN
jgi:hypothetical protein